MAHMHSEGDLANVGDHHESSVSLKTLKRSSPDSLSADEASLERVRKRRAVDKGVQCTAENDKGDEFSKMLVCRPTTPEDEVQSKSESNNPTVESIQTWDYWMSSIEKNDRIEERLVTVQEFTFDPIIMRRELAKMIILHEYPLSMFNHSGFRDFLHKLNPLFGLIPQDTVENDVMKVCKFGRCIAYSELDGCDSGKVAIATKMWTSNDGHRRYLAITGHVIDQEWQKQSYYMRFANVPSPCTNESISKVMLDCLSDAKVERKLSSITVDSYTSDDDLIDILVDKLPKNEFLFGGKLSRLPCFAHTLSLMVQDGFDVIRHVIEKICASIIFWTSSPEREKEFQEVACNLGVSTAKLVLDCDLSWRSTYLMLQESFLFEEVFSHLKHQESCPSKEEWNLAREVCNRLQVLYDHMEALLKFPTCMFFMHICDIKVSLLEWLKCEISGIKEMASKMLEKFDKYWFAARDVLGVATAFHPKFRFFPLKYFFPKIYGNEAEGEIQRIRQIFYDLFKQYKNSPSMVESDDEDKWPQMSSLKYEFLKYLKEEKKKEPELCEVDMYLKERRHTEDSEILSWWKTNKARFPVLHKMAKDFLAIPIFSVDAEHAFDVGNRILGANRSNLPPTVVDALMCTQRWLRNEKHSDNKVPSSAATLHSLGTIYDDANIEHAITLKGKSAE